MVYNSDKMKMISDDLIILVIQKILRRKILYSKVLAARRPANVGRRCARVVGVQSGSESKTKTREAGAGGGLNLLKLIKSFTY